MVYVYPCSMLQICSVAVFDTRRFTCKKRKLLLKKAAGHMWQQHVPPETIVNIRNDQGFLNETFHIRNTASLKLRKRDWLALWIRHTSGIWKTQVEVSDPNLAEEGLKHLNLGITHILVKIVNYVIGYCLGPLLPYFCNEMSQIHCHAKQNKNKSWF